MGFRVVLKAGVSPASHIWEWEYTRPRHGGGTPPLSYVTRRTPRDPEFEADQLIVYAGHVCWTLDIDLLRIPAHWAAAEACVGAKILAISSSIALLSRIRTSAPPGVVQN